MKQVSKKTRTTTILSFDRESLIKSLDLPPDANLYVTVPGGGDWSNAVLAIDSEIVVHCEIVTEETE